MEGNTPADIPDDPNASWRPEPTRAISANLEKVFSAQTTPLPERAISDETRVKPQAVKDPTPLPQVRPAAYTLNRVVAQGGHGEIWQAVQVSLNRVVAVKKVRQKYYKDSGRESLRLLELAFHKEALVTGRLDHPSIVPIYDMGADQSGQPLLAMKLVHGTEWTWIINEDGELDRSAFFAKHLPILIAVCQAVAFAHSRAVIHRDLKPSQVMVGKFGEVYLMDWGLAAIFDEMAQPEGNAPTLPYSINAKDAVNPAGTTAYMAPEQTESTGDRLGPWTDIFLLGATLYRLLTGTPPHDSLTSREAFDKARRCQIEPPEERAPHLVIPEELSRIALKAMAPEIGDRYANVQEFIKALEDYLLGTNRRAESQQLTGQAEALFVPGANYATLSEADNLLTRALNLWQQNASAADLQQRVLQTFAESAVGNGDLGLARAQSVRLTDVSIRDRLLARIDREARRLRRLARQRKLAIAACFLLVVASGGLASWIMHARTEATIRQEKQQAANDAKEAQQQETQRQADLAREQARIANQTSDLYSQEQQLARDLVQEWRGQLTIPPTLEWNPYDDNVMRSKDRAKLADLRSRVQQVQVLRASLDPRALGPPPYTLDYASGVMALYAGDEKTKLAEAEKFFSRAAESGVERHQAIVGLAIAAFRAGQLTSATAYLDRAARIADDTVGSSNDERKIQSLATEVLRKRAEQIHLSPEDLVIESHQGGQNFDHYSDSGPWQDIEKPLDWAKSCAPGTTMLPAWGTRAVRFYTSVFNQNIRYPATATYKPLLPANKHLYVYATWPISANAGPVQYVIQHADGMTTKSLAQDGGAGILQGNGNLWTCLGDYDFTPGDNQYVQLRVDADVKPLRRGWNGQAVADAVLFAQAALGECTTQPRSMDSIPREPAPDWANGYSEALSRAKTENKRLLIYTYSSPGLHSTYCDAQVFPKPAVLEAIKHFVAVRIATQGNKPENFRFGSTPPGTVILCDMNGSEQKRIAPDVVLQPDKLIAELDGQ